MPNALNVTAPLILISYGRSGTSLVHEIFNGTGLYDCVGETANLIFGGWHMLELAYPVVRRTVADGRELDFRTAAAACQQQMFLALFHSERPFWLQKPIGFPDVFWQLTAIAQWSWERIYAWYWDVIRLTFPEAKVFTILRNPSDVFVSSVKYFGFKEQDIWRDLGRMADLLSSPDSLVQHAISFDRLVSDPEAEIRRLCDAVGHEFLPSMLSSTRQLHVPEPTRLVGNENEFRSRAGQSFSHRNTWRTLTRYEEMEAALPRIQALWERFGTALEAA